MANKKQCTKCGIVKDTNDFSYRGAPCKRCEADRISRRNWDRLTIDELENQIAADITRIDRKMEYLNERKEKENML